MKFRVLFGAPVLACLLLSLGSSPIWAAGGVGGQLCEGELTSWYEQPGIVQPVEAFTLDGGLVLAGEGEGTETSVFLTRHFFEKAGMAPEGAKALPQGIGAYRYYAPDAVEPGGRIRRGGGRDHLLLESDGKGGWKATPVSVKGSGTNPKYSDSNGDFQRDDFRTNGLQSLQEVVTEFILVEMLHDAGVPAVEVPKIVLLPEGLQNQLLFGGARPAGGLAAQTYRIQRDARDSLDGFGRVSAEKKKRLIGALLVSNIGHGAINPENLAQGTLVDPGHVGFGLPGMSAAYRCMLCTWIDGSRFDGHMIGILDYSFPTAGENSAWKIGESTRWEGGAKNVSLAVEGVYEALGIHAPPLAAPELESWERALRMNLPLKGGPENDFREDFILALTQSLVGVEIPPMTLYKWTDAVVGVRFLAQLGALEHLLAGDARVSEIRSWVRAQMPSDTGKQDFDLLVNQFRDAFFSAKADATQLAPLFAERLPIGFIESEVKKALGVRISRAELPARIRALRNRLAPAIRYSADSWAEKVVAVVRGLGP